MIDTSRSRRVRALCACISAAVLGFAVCAGAATADSKVHPQNWPQARSQGLVDPATEARIGKLIARFYEFQEGKLLIDGQDIRTFDLSSYRAKLGVVTQTPFLFDGTIAELNVTQGSQVSEGALLVKVEKAAE